MMKAASICETYTERKYIQKHPQEFSLVTQINLCSELYIVLYV